MTQPRGQKIQLYRDVVMINITDILNESVNISMDMMINPRYCEVLEVHLNYNFFITINFIYFIVMFLEMKKGVLTSLEKETGKDIKKIYFIVMLIFNVCMFMFQFALLPLTTMAGG